MQLKKYGIIVNKSKSFIIYNYQELSDRKRIFFYIVIVRGVRYCLIRRINSLELEKYNNIITNENERLRN